MAEEDFLMLLENYLNEEEIEKKKRLDEEIVSVSKIHTDSPFTIADTIPIGKFVNEYLGIQGNCSNLWHSGLKELESDLLFGVDNNFANKNPEAVRSGFLLLVIDARNNRGTYINPRYLENLLNQGDDLNKAYDALRRKRINDLQKLADYYTQYVELSELININERFYKVLEDTHKVGKYRKLLKKRKDKNDKY